MTVHAPARPQPRGTTRSALEDDPDTSLPVDEPSEDHDESHSPEIAPVNHDSS